MQKVLNGPNLMTMPNNAGNRIVSVSTDDKGVKFVTYSSFTSMTVEWYLNEGCTFQPMVVLPFDGLDFLIPEVVEWQTKQFPGSTILGVAEHFKEEADELYAVPTDGQEMADVFMLLVGLAHLNGINLGEEVRKKLEINKARTWGKPNEKGFTKHIGEE